MPSTLNLIVIVSLCIMIGAYCANEKKWEGVIAAIIGIFLCGIALYFRVLGGI